MVLQICIISDGADVFEKLDSLSARSGLPIRSVTSAERYLAGPNAGEAICFIVDLPGQGGLRALETLRRHGVLAPAILVADAGEKLAPKVLSECSVLDVLDRPADKRELLGWIQYVCAARLAIARTRDKLRTAA